MNEKNEDEDKVIIQKRDNSFIISKKWFIGLATFFTVVVVVNDISILIFPNALFSIIIGVSVPIGDAKGHVLEEYDKLRELSCKEETILGVLVKREAFLIYWFLHFIGLYVILFLLACFGIGHVFNMVILGAFTLAAMNILYALIIYDFKIYSQDMRDVFGLLTLPMKVEKLKHIYPRGLNIDRIQFLLHDTLKDTEKNDTRTIKDLLAIFGSDVIKRVDEDGCVPFHLACQYASVEVVKLLDDQYDDDLLNTCDARGNTVLHYACLGNNYVVIKYVLTKYMQLVAKRNIDGDLPVYLLSSCSPFIQGSINGVPVCSNYGRSELDNPQHLETIWKLLLAFPEDVQEKSLYSSPKMIVAESGSSSMGEDLPTQSRRTSSLLLFILILVNMIGAVYMGSLQSVSNVSQQKYHSEVKRLVHELIASQHETNLLRSRMDALKCAQDTAGH